MPLPNYDFCYKTHDGRWIFVPTTESRIVGEEIVSAILKRWSPPQHFYHFKAGGHVAALEIHTQNKYFAKIDIKGFFPNTSKSKLVRALKKTGFYHSKADKIAAASTVISKDGPMRRILPYGFIQSSLLAALALEHSALGKYVSKLCGDGNTCSVYVDDIMISGNDKKELMQQYDELCEYTALSGYQLNERKSIPVSDQVTAFNVDLQQGSMKISEGRYAEFEEELLGSSHEKSTAIIQYVSSICEEQAGRLQEVIS